MSPPTFIPYFIDYNIKNQSKTIGVSKKKITFKFGFANKQAIDDGLVGAHCRGSEHEVVYTWSLNSGKRHVTLDGKDVHFSSSGQNGWTSDRTWQHVFSLKVPGFSGTFRCHLLSQPAPQGSNIKPFDLRVGGISIFKFNQIFQLGTPQMTVRKPGGNRATYTGGSPGEGDDDEPMSPEERRLLAAARVESMREYRSYQERNSQTSPTGSGGGGGTSNGTAGAVNGGERKGGGGEDLLMRFDDAVAPPMPPQQAMQSNPMVSSVTLGSDFTGSFSSLPPGQQQQQQPPYGYQQQQQPNYGQQQPYRGGGGGGYANQPNPSSQLSRQSFTGSATTAPTANMTALTPYQPPPGQAPSGYSYGGSSIGGNTASTTASTQPPAPSIASAMDPYAAAPVDPWATPAPAPPQQQQTSYGQLPPQQQQTSYGQLPPQQQTTSYGQMPPQQQYGGYPQQQQQQQQYPPLQSPMGETQATFGTYGSAPTFAQPPQQQQQQQFGQPQYGQPKQPQYGQPNAYAAPPQYQQYQQPGF